MAAALPQIDDTGMRRTKENVVASKSCTRISKQPSIAGSDLREL